MPTAIVHLIEDHPVHFLDRIINLSLLAPLEALRVDLHVGGSVPSIIVTAEAPKAQVAVHLGPGPNGTPDCSWLFPAHPFIHVMSELRQVGEGGFVEIIAAPGKPELQVRRGSAERITRGTPVVGENRGVLTMKSIFSIGLKPMIMEEVPTTVRAYLDQVANGPWQLFGQDHQTLLFRSQESRRARPGVYFTDGLVVLIEPEAASREVLRSRHPPSADKGP